MLSNAKTDFKYKVHIFDDALTDNTATTIRGYEKKYPNIIKLIYEVKNQSITLKKANRITIYHPENNYYFIRAF